MGWSMPSGIALAGGGYNDNDWAHLHLYLSKLGGYPGRGRGVIGSDVVG